MRSCVAASGGRKGEGPNDATASGEGEGILDETLELLRAGFDRIAAVVGTDWDVPFVVSVAVAAAIGLVVGVLVARPARPGAKIAPKASTTAAPALPDPDAARREGYRRVLSAKGVPADALEATLDESVARAREIGDELLALKPDDGEVGALVAEARAAFAAGELRRVVNLLFKSAERDAALAEDRRAAAARHRHAAATVLALVGDLEITQLEYESAAECFRRALDGAPPGDDEFVAECAEKLGTAAYRAGNPAAAKAAFLRAIEAMEKIRGSEDGELAPLLNNLALLHFVEGDLAGAEPLYKRALATDEKARGPTHPNVATDLNNLGLLYKKQGDFKAAEPMFKRSLAIKEKTLGQGHPSLLTGYRNYAALLRAMDRNKEAEAMEARANAPAASGAQAAN